MNINKLELGSVSHGTLRPEDLVPAFVEFAQYLEIELPQEALDDAAAVSEGTFDREDSDVVGDLIDLIENELPEFLRFGAHEGDGSDFGVWAEADYAEELGDALLAVAKAEVGGSNDDHIAALQAALELALEQISWG